MWQSYKTKDMKRGVCVAALVLVLAAAACGQGDWVAELRRGRFSVEELMEARTRDFGSIRPTYVQASVTLPKGTGVSCARAIFRRLLFFFFFFFLLFFFSSFFLHFSSSDSGSFSAPDLCMYGRQSQSPCGQQLCCVRRGWICASRRVISLLMRCGP